MPPKAHLAFLLHMHQPSYVDPLSRKAELPWVRLHAARAYLDVATLLDEYEHIRLTVNFVPSLVAQLKDVVAGVPDTWLELNQRPVRDLSPDEKVLILERMFSIHWGRCIDPRPRYRELLEKRGRGTQRNQLRARLRDFSDQ